MKNQQHGRLDDEMNFSETHYPKQKRKPAYMLMN